MGSGGISFSWRSCARNSATSSLVAITQPDFFPWLGSIDKLRRADTFVYLDHVTNRPSDGIWTKRVKLLIGGEPRWVSVPLRTTPGVEFVRICDMEIATEVEFADKHLRSIETSYRKAPFFAETFPLVEAFYRSDEPRIARRNIAFLETIAGKLGLTNRRLVSSEMGCRGRSNELLVEITTAVGGSRYLVGEGSLGPKGYLRRDLFEAAGIEVVRQSFQHPTYAQVGSRTFVPGLSAIDALMNCGVAGTRAMLDSSVAGEGTVRVG